MDSLFLKICFHIYMDISARVKSLTKTKQTNLQEQKDSWMSFSELLQKCPNFLYYIIDSDTVDNQHANSTGVDILIWKLAE